MEKQKVLIVDDMPNLLKLGKAIFETGGYTIITATDGIEALDALANNTIALVITDILMPNMDGYSLCYHIRNNEATRDIPIIVYSATYISKSDEKLALEVGADMFICKPASMNFLLTAARELTSRPAKIRSQTGYQIELNDVTRQYNSRLIEKLEQKNVELEQAQAQLIKSERRFRAIVEDISDAISLHDEKGNILYQSPGSERITGYTIEETKRMKPADFFHPDEVPEMNVRLETVLKNPGKAIYRTNRMRHKDGHYIWTEGTTTNLLADENVNAVVANYRDITERKLAEEQTKKSETNLKAILENSSESLFLTDNDGIILSINNNAKQTNLLTFDEEMQVGRNVVDYIVESRKDLFRKMISDASAGVSIQYDQSFTDLSGRYHCYDFGISPVKEDGVIKGICFNGRDITERKLNEEKLERNEKRLEAERERFANLFLQAPSCICILKGPTHVFEMANPLYLEFSGKENVIGKTAVEVFPELVEQGYLDLLNNVYNTGEPFAAKEVLMQIQRDVKGQYVDLYVDFVYQPYKNSEGEIDGIFFFANIVTEQVVARKKIERNEKRFRSLLENAGDIIAMMDKEGVILYVSPAYKKVTGFTPEEVIGKHYPLIMHPVQAEESLKIFASLFANPGVAVPRTNRFLHKNGSYVWAEGTLNNLLEDENVGAVVANYRDITERKTAEQKLLNANRLYAFISGINQLIVHAENEQHVFKEACRIATEVGKFKMAWIGLFDRTRKKINRVESKGIQPEDLALFADIPYHNKGPQAHVINNGASYICNDIEIDLETVSWKPFAARTLLRSCMVLPIKKSGVVWGTLNLYSSEINLFDAQEILLLEEIAGDISFALDVFEKEKNKKLMEEEIVHSELRLKQAQAIAHFGSWEMDFATGIALWSEEACRIYGFSPEDNRQTYDSWVSYLHPDDLEHVMDETKKAGETLSSSAFHHRIIRRNGTVRHIFSEAHFEINDEGKPTGLYGVAHDITEQKLSEAERTKMVADIVQRNKTWNNFPMQCPIT